LNSAWSSFTKFTEWLAGETGKAIDATVSTLKTWVGGFVNTFVEATAGSFFTGVNKGIEPARKSPLETDKDSDNEILRGLQHYMKKYREERDKEEES